MSWAQNLLIKSFGFCLKMANHFLKYQTYYYYNYYYCIWLCMRQSSSYMILFTCNIIKECQIFISIYLLLNICYAHNLKMPMRENLLNQYFKIKTLHLLKSYTMAVIGTCSRKWKYDNDLINYALHNCRSVIYKLKHTKMLFTQSMCVYNQGKLFGF